MNTLTKIIITIFCCTLLGIACGDPNISNKTNEDEVVVEQKETIKTPIAKATSLGKRLFILCEACHSLKKGEAHKVGPNLYGIFGAKAGVAEGFKYSEAMIASEIVWDDEKMRAWLENPTDFIPGANMAFVGIKKEKQMDALIEYLKEETK